MAKDLSFEIEICESSVSWECLCCFLSFVSFVEFLIECVDSRVGKVSATTHRICGSVAVLAVLCIPDTRQDIGCVRFLNKAKYPYACELLGVHRDDEHTYVRRPVGRVLRHGKTEMETCRGSDNLRNRGRLVLLVRGWGGISHVKNILRTTDLANNSTTPPTEGSAEKLWKAVKKREMRRLKNAENSKHSKRSCTGWCSSRTRPGTGQAARFQMLQMLDIFTGCFWHKNKPGLLWGVKTVLKLFYEFC